MYQFLFFAFFISDIILKNEDEKWRRKNEICFHFACELYLSYLLKKKYPKGNPSEVDIKQKSKVVPFWNLYEVLLSLPRSHGARDINISHLKLLFPNGSLHWSWIVFGRKIQICFLVSLHEYLNQKYQLIRKNTRSGNISKKFIINIAQTPGWILFHREMVY